MELSLIKEEDSLLNTHGNDSMLGKINADYVNLLQNSVADFLGVKEEDKSKVQNELKSVIYYNFIIYSNLYNYRVS